MGIRMYSSKVKYAYQIVASAHGGRIRAEREMRGTKVKDGIIASKDLSGRAALR